MDGPQGSDSKNAGIAAALAASLAFLTRIPFPTGLTSNLPPLRQAMWAFPVIGAAIGGLAGLALAALTILGPPPLAAAGLTLGLLALLTGGLHEDGLADTADGFGGGGTRERKLEIMRDSRIGTYGVLALVLVVTVKAAALAPIAGGRWYEIVGATLSAAAASRALIVWFVHATPPARPNGLSATAGRPTRTTATLALAMGVAASLGASWATGGPGAMVLALAIAALAMLALRSLAVRQIGGQTGDVCGAIQMVTETLMLTVISATFH